MTRRRSALTESPPHPALRATFSHGGEKESGGEISRLHRPLPSVGEGSGARAVRPLAKLGKGGHRSARLSLAAAAFTAFALLASPALAETIANPVAAFSGLDKITGRITKFDVYIDETVQFGALQITPRVCYTRPPTETQRTSVFLEVDQVSLKGQITRVFTGWMFADSPALHAIDHAVYDIWLDDCRQSTDVPPPEAVNAPAVEAPDATQAAVDDRG
jgi:hypothetical protein